MIRTHLFCFGGKGEKSIDSPLASKQSSSGAPEISAVSKQLTQEAARLRVVEGPVIMGSPTQVGRPSAGRQAEAGSMRVRRRRFEFLVVGHRKSFLRSELSSSDEPAGVKEI
mmetsp:Transcript_5157/g.10695  ORF Transcript_5157/g.10695 Transcript_5157/m.10695 type:complete len:112 (-) Transcript_5157:1818-2153(-)